MGGAGLRGPIELVVIFSYQKNVRLEGIELSFRFSKHLNHKSFLYNAILLDLLDFFV